MKGKTCCVTGHRDLPQNEINKIKTALAHEIDAAVTDGFTCFMSGFADQTEPHLVDELCRFLQATYIVYHSSEEKSSIFSLFFFF